MKIIVNIDYIRLVAQAVAPRGELVCSKRPVAPAPVAKAQAHVVRKGRIAQQKIHLGARNRAVHPVGAAPAKHLIRTLGQRGFKTKLLQGGGKVIVEHAFRMHEGGRLFAKQFFDTRTLRLDLSVKFLA